jgi:hypothetical protein
MDLIVAEPEAGIETTWTERAGDATLDSSATDSLDERTNRGLEEFFPRRHFRLDVVDILL